MAAYTFVNKNIPQTKSIIGKNMVENLAGAMAFKAEDFNALDRWLLTGSSSNMFYQNKQDATDKNVDVLLRCITKDPIKVAERIIYASDHGISNSTPIFALALLSASTDMNAKIAFRNIFNKIIRTASHLYEFLEYVKSVRGFGKTIHKAVNNWIVSNKNLEYQFLKYQSRNGWEHRDVLRKFHVTPKDEYMNAIFHWAVKGYNEKDKEILKIIPYFETIKQNQDETSVINAIRDGKLSWEMVVGNCQKMTTKIWQELFFNMPMTATIRYLATLTANDVLKNKDNLDILENRLLNDEMLIKARIHPIQFCKALSIYQTGGQGSEHSTLVYDPIRRVIDILNAGIEKASEHLEPTGKNIFISVDVSASMWYGHQKVYGNLMPGQIAGILALSVVKAEKNYTVGMFDNNFGLMNIDKGVSYGRIMDRENGIWPKHFGGTDASLPYKYAMDNKMEIDTFICLTDNESWAGYHPFIALKSYRKAVNNNAKAIYVSLMPYGDATTLVDPSDEQSYDIAGFSDQTVKLIQMIIQGL